MKRREFITLLGGAVAWPVAARAQQGERLRRIGVLPGGQDTDDPRSQPNIAAFLQALQQLVWADGRNVKIEYRWPTGDADKTRKYAAELVAFAPDVTWQLARHPWLRCFRRHAPCRLCSWASPIQSAPVMSIVCRGRAATPLALSCSITV
jgi:hypothetical protein